MTPKLSLLEALSLFLGAAEFIECHGGRDYGSVGREFGAHGMEYGNPSYRGERNKSFYKQGSSTYSRKRSAGSLKQAAPRPAAPSQSGKGLQVGRKKIKFD